MEDTVIKGFLEYGSTGLVAGAIIYLVKYMLDSMRTSQKEEREFHEKEVDKLASTYAQSIQAIGAALKDLTERLTDEIRHERKLEERDEK